MKAITIPAKLLDFSSLERTLQELAERIKDLETSNTNLKNQLQEQKKKSEDREVELEALIKQETSSLTEIIEKQKQVLQEGLAENSLLVEKSASTLEEKIESTRKEVTTDLEAIFASKIAELTVKFNSINQHLKSGDEEPIFQHTTINATGDKPPPNNNCNADIHSPDTKQGKNSEQLEKPLTRASKTSPSGGANERSDAVQDGSDAALNLNVPSNNTGTPAQTKSTTKTPSRSGQLYENETAASSENLAIDPIQPAESAEESTKLSISNNQIHKFRSMMLQEISRYFKAQAGDGQTEPKTKREAEVINSIQTIRDKIVVMENKMEKEVKVPINLIKELKHHLYKTTGNSVFRPRRDTTDGISKNISGTSMAPLISEEEQENLSKIEEYEANEPLPKSNDESSTIEPENFTTDPTNTKDEQRKPSPLTFLQTRVSQQVRDRAEELNTIKTRLHGLGKEISTIKKSSEKHAEVSSEPLDKTMSNQTSLRSTAESVLVQLINVHQSTLTKNIDMYTDIDAIQESFTNEIKSLKRAIEKKADLGAQVNCEYSPEDGKPHSAKAKEDDTYNEVTNSLVNCTGSQRSSLDSGEEMQKLQEKLECVQDTVDKLQKSMNNYVASSKMEKASLEAGAKDKEVNSKTNDHVNKMKQWISTNSTDIGSLRTEVLGIKTLSSKLDAENQRMFEDSNRLKEFVNQKANLRDVVELRAMIENPAIDNALLSGMCISCNRSSAISPFPGYHISQNIAMPSPVRRNTERRKESWRRFKRPPRLSRQLRVVAGFRPHKSKEALFDHTGYPSSNSKLIKSISSPILPPISPQNVRKVHVESMDFTQRRNDIKHSKKAAKYQRTDDCQ